jgi:uncharacterized protein (TIGR02246 family)
MTIRFLKSAPVKFCSKARKNYMRVYYLRATAIFAVASSAFGATASSSEADAIRALEARQESAWNDHDAHAYAQLFTIDADTVNVLGWWWKSRAELEQKLDKGFSFVFARSRLKIEDVTVRMLNANVAVVHVRWSMTGAASPDGSGSNVPQKGIQTQVVYKAEGRWLIAAFQNTNAVEERQFPTRPNAPADSR